MKFFSTFFFFFFIFFFFSQTQAQNGYVTKILTQYGGPCAKEAGISKDAIANLEAEDFFGGKVASGMGCFTDCVATKMGLLGDDGFHVSKYKDRVVKVFQADTAKKVMDTCSDKIGTEKCKVTGSVLHCTLNVLVDTLFE
uniref:Proteinral odorant-binding protein 56d n=2 Tax=Nyssomyia neivai TaxID=330878 RepID=A0A1L8DPD3_9DIPT